ncbi:MAG: iron-containing alcohol dehydrogenase [Bacteroidales bacterium]|jgi:alcohol dehydrogenase class IV
MAKPFQFAAIPRIYFGHGRLSLLPALIREYGDSFILVTGESSFMDSSGGKSLINGIHEAGIGFEHIGIPSEPSPEIIDNAVRTLGTKGFNVLVAVGGGSVIDSGKAISAMMYMNEPVTDFLEGVGTKVHPGTKIPCIAVPTTSGTGSEATKNAVISRTGNNGFKKSLRHDNFVPDIALVDPGLTVSCPPEITAASGMDCFTQLAEAYLSDKSSEYTDALATEAFKEIKSSLLKAFIDGSDIEARSGMSFAALTSGICLANAGLGVVHGFASSIGGMYSIPHGVICGTLMAKANEVSVRKLRMKQDGHRALKKYALLGKIFVRGRRANDDYYIDGFISYLHDLTNELYIPGLKESGVREDSLERICELTECKNNPVKLDRSDLMEIVSERFV